MCVGAGTTVVSGRQGEGLLQVGVGSVGSDRQGRVVAGELAYGQFDI